MKEKYKGKIKVPFCVKFVANKVSAILSEILGYEVDPSGVWNYYGVDQHNIYDFSDAPEPFGENTTVYTLEELKAIIDSVEEDIASEDSDGWIEWKGGEIPVPYGTKVDVKHRNGSTFRNQKAGESFCNYWLWDSGKAHYEIVAYRIIDTSEPSCSDDTATLATDEYVGMGEGETGSTALVGNSTEVKVNLSFDVTIKGQTFTLTTDEIRDLYLQLCNAEGVLKDWELG